MTASVEHDQERQRHGTASKGRNVPAIPVVLGKGESGLLFAAESIMHQFVA